MEKIVAKVGCIFIPVTDVKRSAEWYVRMFDMETIEILDHRAGLKFPLRETLVLLWKVAKPQTVEFDTGIDKMPYYNFSSYDIHSSYRMLQGKGAAVSEVHEMPGYRFFETFDPDGNPVSIVEETPESPYYEHKQQFRNHT
ncbi:VOC family protein [Paenibacillus sp. P26]|nr:VOC family protein [Paenibacillus sp. P26]UUZ92081.1 VOC family protein [Paenibacillus sp. P25]